MRSRRAFAPAAVLGFAMSFVGLQLMSLGTASAAAPSDLGLQYETAVKGQATPALVLHPNIAIKQASIELTPAAGGATQKIAVGAVAAGSTRRLSFRHGGGRTAYKGIMNVKWADGDEARYDFDFEAVRYQPMRLEMTFDDVDMSAHQVTCRPSHETSRLELELLDADGSVLGSEVQSFDPPAAGGTDLTIGWDASIAPARMVVKAIDPDGVWASIKVDTFTISIPHDEVQFALGSATIDAAEQPKLETTLGQLKAALKEHGTLLDLKLFIAGYTDTVGDRASNQALSLKRAAAIAKWFRTHGIRLAIYFRGFGEDELAVGTPDETDEVRNRRAQYILSVHPPLGVRVAAGGGGWTSL